MPASPYAPGAASHPLRQARLAALAAFETIERLLDRVGGPTRNPLRHLGALGFLLLWLLTASGIYLFAVFDTSAEGAYRSIDRISREQWYLGGVVRSVHRYAADAFVVVVLLHLLREALMGRYSAFRRVSWLTGVPLLLFVFASAIGGFWLNWDQLGQFSAMATAELLDALPLFGSPLMRNFLGVDTVSDRLFSLFIFVHVGVALFLVFGLWFHIQRLSHAEVLPPRPMAMGVLLGLLVLALAAPVLSHAPADLRIAPASLALDWILLFIHPLTDATSPALVWSLLALVLLLLLGLPFLPQPPKPRWRWSIRPTAAAAGAVSTTARTPPSPWWRTRPATGASWPRSTLTCARAAASASAPAPRRRRFAMRPNSSPASTCPQRRSARCASDCARVWRHSARRATGSSCSTASTASTASPSRARVCSRSSWSAPRSCRRRSWNTRCVTAPPVSS